MHSSACLITLLALVVWHLQLENVASVQLQGAQSDDGRNQYPCGYPCDKDEWCGITTKRCRFCFELDDYCRDILLIQQNYSSCVPYCFRRQEEETQKLKEQRENEGSALKNCSKTLSQLEQKLQTTREKYEEKAKEMVILAKDLDHCHQTIERSKAEKRKDSECKVQGYAAGMICAVILVVASTSVAVWKTVENQKLKSSKVGSFCSESLINCSGGQEVKSPIKVDRSSTHFKLGDEYCLAGVGGQAHAESEDSN